MLNLCILELQCSDMLVPMEYLYYYPRNLSRTMKAPVWDGLALYCMAANVEKVGQTDHYEFLYKCITPV